MAGPIRGRYQAIGVVGAGSQGQVICARDQMHDRLVALKVRHVGSPEEREQLLAEARTLLALRPHPGLPLVREDFFEDDHYYLVMDWIDGVDLSRLLDQAGTDGLPYAEVLDLLTDVADALDHVHAHEPPVVHKDVKPANIVVLRSGRAVLVDFGLSGPSGHHHGRPGTVGFQAPEVSSGGMATPASDVFSLAATAYFLLSGAPPEPGDRPRWRGVPPALIPRVQEALARGLAIEPSQRPSARVLVELLAARAVANNLPAALTKFIGRNQELNDFARDMSRARLLTLTGAGGVGKTRLAVEIADRTSWAYPDGVWMVELGRLADPAFVTAELAKTLDVREEPGRRLAATLCDHLRERQLLLLFDNCEHVLESAAETAERLLQAAPGVSILATSREPLELFGEVARRVPSLSAPEPGKVVSADDLSSYEAVALFCDRASIANADFSLDSRSAADVIAICAALDGIPLALEMAAARLREMSLEEVAAGLTDSLRLRGARTAPSRQQTLAATVAWSYRRLAPDAAALFRRLSVLVGTFKADDVKAVCSDEDVPASKMSWLLTRLLHCSMIVGDDVAQSGQGDGRGPSGPSEATSDAARYRLLETLRRYGAEKVAETGETAALENRHIEWFVSVAEAGEDRLFGPAEGEVLARIEEYNDNFRIALQRAIDQGRLDAAFRLARALSRFWNVRGYWTEGRQWLEALLVAWPDAPTAYRAKTLVAAAVMAENQGDFDPAVRFGEEGLRLAREEGDAVTAAEALNSLSNVAQAQGQQGRSETLLELCLTQWRASGRARGIVSSFAGALGALGWRAVWRGHHRQARRLFAEALVVARELQIRRAQVNALLGLATVAEGERELDEAGSYVEQARVISRQLADRRFLGLELYLDGLIALDEGEPEEAAVRFASAVKEAASAGDMVLFLRAVEGMARVACARSDASAAAALFGAAAAMRRALPWPLSPADGQWYDSAVASAREAGEALFSEAWSRGAAMRMEEVTNLALQQARAEPRVRPGAV